MDRFPMKRLPEPKASSIPAGLNGCAQAVAFGIPEVLREARAPITPFIRASLRSTKAKEKSRKSASASARKAASSRGKTQNPARVRRPMIQNTQIVYAKPPADGALPDPAGTFNVVHTPFDTEAKNLKAGEVLVENQYLSIDPYHRFGLYDPAVTRSQFPATRPRTIISTYGVSRVVRSASPEYA